MATATAILGFYTLVAGWVLAHGAAHLAELAGLSALARWALADGLARDLTFALAFALLTLATVAEGVRRGIERWSRRLMPALLLLLVLLIGYVLRQPEAGAGLAAYLLPEPSRLVRADLLLSAMGQAFFSLSLGVGTMLVYGSYLPRGESLPLAGALVTALDLGIAFLAGLLVLPALFVAAGHGRGGGG
ncbi:MAG: hypothetical protein KatS3mg124_2049 [Porticoccaceae bacterium]|nr:MAG: hypothetical protein KatS3mg124_2049 [Porticoccaceae bacterium]